MVPIIELWLPILLSAVVVFILSSIIHMVLKYHNNDFSEIPSEEQVIAEIGKHNLPPGEYHFPHAKDMKEMGSPEYVEKLKRGPVGFMTIMENAPMNMGKSLTQWFIYCVIVGVFVAYVTGLTNGPGEHYLSVFRIAGTTAFIAYGLALWQSSIWYKSSWKVNFKNNIDGLIYALFTAGIFGWLWPV
jgi:hypothetical protein